MKLRLVALVLVLVLIGLLIPTPVMAADCGLLSILFGGDCVSQLSGAMQENIETVQDGQTDRVEIEQTNETARVLAQETNETLRAMAHETNETLRAQIAADAAKDLGEQQTMQVMADALARQNITDRLAQSAETIALIDARSDLLVTGIEHESMVQRASQYTMLVDRALILALIAMLGMMAFANRRQIRKPIRRPARPPAPQPTWRALPEPNTLTKQEAMVYEDAEL